VAHKAGHGANHLAHQAGHTANQVAHKVGHGANHLGHQVAHGAVDTLHKVEHLVAAAELEIVRHAANLAAKRQKAFLSKIGMRLGALQKNVDARQALRRLQLAASARRVDSEVQADMRYLGDRLGILAHPAGHSSSGQGGHPQANPKASSQASSNAASGAPRPMIVAAPAPAPSEGSSAPDRGASSCWGLLFGGSGGAVGGYSIVVGMLANCKVNPGGGMDVRFAVESTVLTGAELGGALEAVFFWSPGSIDTQSGGFVGIGAEFVVGAGIIVGVQWSMPRSYKIDQIKQIVGRPPSFLVGVGAGVEAGVELEFGQLQVH
jgi:hypothetical protein